MTYWILENKLGTCAVGEEVPKGSIVHDVRYLVDGKNTPLNIWLTVVSVRKSLSSGNPIIIQCQAGMSRSNAIAIMILCLRNNRSWEENEEFVRKKVPRTLIDLSLKDSCKKALRYGRKRKSS